MNRSWLIRNCRILDPARNLDQCGDIRIENGAIVDPRTPFGGETRIVAADGMWAVPGFIDLHVHFREPGNEEAETISSGCMAAARGGFTTVVTMPNTNPATDTPAMIRRTLEGGSAHKLTRVLPSGCITKSRAGAELADLDAMAEAGAIAFTDDGATVADENLMRTAMQAAKRLRRAIMDHALDPVLAGKGVMHLGHRSAALNLPGMPSEAETEIVKRDIRLARETGCVVHIQHISAGESVDLIRQAKREGLPVSAEATPHHISLTDADVKAESPEFKMNPPLRGEEDRKAILAGLADGTIEVLATDHAPHRQSDKDKGFILAPFGVVGLETAIGVTFTTLVKGGILPPLKWVAKWTTGPAMVLGLDVPSLAQGNPADIVLIDATTEWTVQAARFASKSRNTPFGGARLTGSPFAVFFRNGNLTTDLTRAIDTARPL